MIPPPNDNLHWWDCRRPIDRRDYLVIGAGLMLLKYFAELAAIYALTGRFYTLVDFFSPLASRRLELTRGAPEWFTPLWLVGTLPFVAIAVVLTIRRAIDAGRSPWWGFAILIPIVNLLVMLALAAIPTTDQEVLHDPDRTRPDLQPDDGASPLQATLLGAGVGGVYALCLTLVSVYLFHSYGAALFFGTPMVAGAFAAFTYNFRTRRGWAKSLLVATLPVILLGLGLILIALEGAVCIILAAPIMLPPALVGGAVGKGIADLNRADWRRRRELAGCLIVLPALAFGESRLPRGAECCVTSYADVAAPPEVVWERVVIFPEIDAPLALLFRLGVAAPRGARIDGRGVGAVRRCDFTTGSFVEPIRVWDPPRRLAFDVTQQPDPMTELSPYRDVHPPHLNRTFKSTHGEFVLEPLADGGTRLVGRTWYRLDLAPTAYFTMLADGIIHRIHLRVLEHIKGLAESDSLQRRRDAAR